jgi:hypothetical protein
VLALLLVGLEPPMPKCRILVGESGVKAVERAARDARDEIKAALEDLAQPSVT